MNNNINYIIQEASPNTTFDPTTFDPTTFDPTTFDLEHYSNAVVSYNYEELYILYLSYTVKSLTQIIDYYGINKYNINNKKKLVKDEIIQMLIFFELSIENRDIVLKRQRLWNNIAELSNDNYFKNYIMFTV
jgi:hypothetical protein